MTRPNILLISADQQRADCLGFMGRKVKTPHLDALSRRSLVMDRGYVSAPLCRPSLASMVTGLFPFEHGITGNDVDGRNNRAALDVPMREAYQIIKTNPNMKRLNIEVEFDPENDGPEEARRREYEAVVESIRFVRQELGVGQES